MHVRIVYFDPGKHEESPGLMAVMAMISGSTNWMQRLFPVRHCACSSFLAADALHSWAMGMLVHQADAHFLSTYKGCESW